VVQPSTDEPGVVFAPGRRVFADYADPKAPRSTGYNAPRECIVQSSRPFKDAWLVKLDCVHDKTEADLWRGVTFEVPADELPPPNADENELYEHEIAGMRVRDDEHGELGIVEAWYEVPQGLVLEVRGAEWRADVPFNEAFVTKVDRIARVIDVRLPDGLLEPARSRPPA
jgi:16S rRNA processing protein RimM